ncbi:MAG: hypothetical protein U1D30_26045 [Planctomycetota bacterium]
MNTVTISLAVFLCMFVAALIGMLLRRILPEHHLSSETKDTVNLAMGFVATMAALVLGLIVASAKDSFDKQSAGVTQMAAKIVYRDRLLANYGTESAKVRELYRRVVQHVTNRMWPDTNSGESQLDPTASHTEALFIAIQSLEPKNELQKTVKDQAVATSLQLGEMRWLEYEQAATSATNELIIILVFWLAVLFTSFNIFAPSNGTVVAAMMMGALSVAAAIFLILELRSPFDGIIQVPNTQFLDAIAHLGR